MNRFIKWLLADPQERIPILIAVIGIAGTVIGGFFSVVIWPWVKIGLEMLWRKFRTLLSGRVFEDRYLDWVVKQHEYLPILPTTLVPVAERRVHALDQLYVSLTVAEGVHNADKLDLGRVLAQSRHVVILGDPGAGKTTMLRYLALTFSRARLGSPTARRKESRTHELKEVKSAQARVRQQFEYAHCPLPILVYLNRFRDIAQWEDTRSLLDAVREDLQGNDILRQVPDKFFEKKLARGECIFLLDAFDELATQEARDAAAFHIGRLATATPDGNRFVVSSRIVGYDGQLARFGFTAFKVQPLGSELISQLVTKWYLSLNEPVLAEQLLKTLDENPRIQALAVNPMLLSLIVLVQYVRRIIPDRRHVLYDECVKILVERRYAPPKVQEQYNLLLSGEDAVKIMRYIGLRMHSQHLRDIPRPTIELVLIPQALAEAYIETDDRVTPAEILKNIEQRSQLLVERGYDEAGVPVMAFSHLTFQEYLASVALKESTGVAGEASVSDHLLSKYQEGPEWWEEVALLYAAQLDGPQRRSFFQRFYPSTREMAE